MRREDVPFSGKVPEGLKTFFLLGTLGILLLFTAGDLEELLGLEILFFLRGERTPPQELCIISLDKRSADRFMLPDDPEKWPRSLHAGLVEKLHEQGAAVVAYNVFFQDSRGGPGDDFFAESMARAGNVVLCQNLKKDVYLQGDQSILLERLLSPAPPFAESAAGLAPFTIPKVPVKVSRFWAFKNSAGDCPSFPVVAYQLFSSPFGERFSSLVKKHCPSQKKHLLKFKEENLHNWGMAGIAHTLRSIFIAPEFQAEQFFRDLKTLSSEERTLQAATALADLYFGPDLPYLNFYGPAGTIPTYSFGDVLEGKLTGVDIKNKAVFVGKAENVRPEDQEGFHTVYSQSDGMDLSGVEIAATAFANIHERAFLVPFSMPWNIFLVFVWGGLLALVMVKLPLHRSIPLAIIFAGIYTILSLQLFSGWHIWSPLVVPLGLQFPLTLTWGLFRAYRHSVEERHTIRKAFGLYLPEPVVEKMVSDSSGIGSVREVVSGICLSTDAQSYAAVAEHLSPESLQDLMNRYYSYLFEPVVLHGGVVTDVVGDAMMAVWIMGKGDHGANPACMAALEVARAADRFNRVADHSLLPTRLGLHAGKIILGSIGAGDHYEYRAVGDPVNCASRLESLNKQLGTRILISGEVLKKTRGFLTRPMGKFLLQGKTRPIKVFELVCTEAEARERDRQLCEIFEVALEAFQQNQWRETRQTLRRSLEECSGQDGPSRFYIELCEQYMHSPPEMECKGVITMGAK
ncbi:MAG: CHASE2 domain-containing protein [bacterium]